MTACLFSAPLRSVRQDLRFDAVLLHRMPSVPLLMTERKHEECRRCIHRQWIERP